MVLSAVLPEFSSLWWCLFIRFLLEQTSHCLVVVQLKLIICYSLLCFFLFCPFDRNEPVLLPNQQPKKRRRKDSAKGNVEGDDVAVPHKHAKVRKKETEKSVPLVGKTSTGPSHVVALPSVRPEEMKFQNQMNSSAVSAKKKYAETKTSFDPSRSSKVSEGDASLLRPEEKDIDKQKTMAPSNFQGDKLKDGGDFADASVPGKSSHAQSKTQLAKPSNDVDELDQAVQRREKDGIRERFDLNVSEGTHSTQTVVSLSLSL